MNSKMTKEERAKLREKIYELREQGLKIHEIGEKLGITQFQAGYYLSAKGRSMALEGVKSKKIKKEKEKHSHANGSSRKKLVNGEPTPHEAYALGHVESWLELYAKSNNLSFAVLAGGVGSLLQRKAGRGLLGS